MKKLKRIAITIYIIATLLAVAYVSQELYTMYHQPCVALKWDRSQHGPAWQTLESRYCMKSGRSEIITGRWVTYGNLHRFIDDNQKDSAGKAQQYAVDVDPIVVDLISKFIFKSDRPSEQPLRLRVTVAGRKLTSYRPEFGETRTLAIDRFIRIGPELREPQPEEPKG